MNTTLNLTTPTRGFAPAWPSPELEARRRHITALGRLYLEAGLPLASAFAAALADYESFAETLTVSRT